MVQNLMIARSNSIELSTNRRQVPVTIPMPGRNSASSGSASPASGVVRPDMRLPLDGYASISKMSN